MLTKDELIHHMGDRDKIFALVAEAACSGLPYFAHSPFWDTLESLRKHYDARLVQCRRTDPEGKSDKHLETLCIGAGLTMLSDMAGVFRGDK